MKKLKRILLIFITFALATLSNPLPISANNVDIKLHKSGVIRRGYYIAKNSKGESVSSKDGYNFITITVNGEVAFCIEPEVLVGSGGGYTSASFTHAEREMFSRILYHGYDTTNKTPRDIIIAQHVLWDYIDSIRDDLTINSGWYYDAFDYPAEKAKIMAKVNAHNKSASFHGKTHNIVQGETVTLNDSNGVLANSVLIDNGGLNVSVTNNQLKVTATKDSPSKGVIKFKKFGNITNNTSTAPILYSHPSEQNVIVGGNPDPIIYSVNFNVEHNGTLRIGKMNEETEQMAANTEFELSSNKDMSNSTVYKTVSNGYTNKLSLLAGTYYYREKFVPNPLIVDTTIKEVKITPGIDTEVKVSNKVAKAKIEVLKLSTNDDFIKGVVFEVKDAKQNVVETLTTDSKGFATTKSLPLGVYTLTEVFTPEPYVLDETVRTLDIKYKDQTTEVITSVSKIANKFQRSDLTLNKVENDWDKVQSEYNGLKLSDATLELYAKDDIYEGSKLVYRKDQLIGKEITDQFGQVKFHNLPLGDYYAKETVAPKGYIIFDGVWNISIKYDKDKPTVEVTHTESTLTNQIAYGKSKIHKTGKGGSEFLANAVFGLFKEDGTKLFEYTTDKKGEVTSVDLRFGTYYWKELVAPLGYHLDDTKHYFTITEEDHESVIHLAISNEYIKAKVLVSKIDSETKYPLENVGFKILDSNNEIVTIKYQEGKNIIEKNEWFTDSDGQFLLEASLPYGKYTLIESKPLEGYVPMEPYKFEIGDDQKYLDIEIIGKVLDLGDIENTKIYGDIKILKLDEETGLPLANTVFELYDSQMELLDTITTNEDGIALLEHIVYGQYFIKEIEVPFPYVIDKDSQLQQVFIKENQEVYEVIFKNKTTSITISKNDKVTKEPIPNTIFNIYDENKLLLHTVTTGEDGLAIVEGLEYGDYFVEELFVPEPYILNPDNKLQEFILSKDNNNYEVKFENDKAVGELKLIKIDRKTNKPVEGIKFNLYDITDIDITDITHEFLLSLDTIKSDTTPADGTLKFTDLDISRKYALIEVESIYGYKLTDEVFTVDFDYIDQDTPIIENTLDVYNEREEVVIRAVKKDLSDNSVIKDKHFVLELSDHEGNIIEPKSFKDGVYTWDALALETYTLKETVAPAGYSLSNKVIKIDTSKQTENNVYTVEFFNSKIPKTGINNQAQLYIILIGLSVITITITRKRKLSK